MQGIGSRQRGLKGKFPLKVLGLAGQWRAGRGLKGKFPLRVLGVAGRWPPRVGRRFKGKLPLRVVGFAGRWQPGGCLASPGNGGREGA